MLSSSEIKNHVLKRGIGYSKRSVDDFLAEIAKDYEALYKENVELKDKATALSDGLQYYKSIEKTLQKALVLAQKTADDEQETASKRASMIERNARIKADEVLTKAKTDLDTIFRQTDDLNRRFELYKAHVKNLITTQLEFINSDAYNITVNDLEGYLKLKVQLEEAKGEVDTQKIEDSKPEVAKDGEDTVPKEETGSEEKTSETQENNENTSEVNTVEQSPDKEAVTGEDARKEVNNVVIRNDVNSGVVRTDAGAYETVRQRANHSETHRAEVVRPKTARTEAGRQDIIRQKAVRPEEARQRVVRSEIDRPEVVRTEINRSKSNRVVSNQMHDAMTIHHGTVNKEFEKGSIELHQDRHRDIDHRVMEARKEVHRDFEQRGINNIDFEHRELVHNEVDFHQERNNKSLINEDIFLHETDNMANLNELYRGRPVSVRENLINRIPDETVKEDDLRKYETELDLHGFDLESLADRMPSSNIYGNGDYEQNT